MGFWGLPGRLTGLRINILGNPLCNRRPVRRRGKSVSGSFLVFGVGWQFSVSAQAFPQVDPAMRFRIRPGVFMDALHEIMEELDLFRVRPVTVVDHGRKCLVEHEIAQIPVGLAP